MCFFKKNIDLLKDIQNAYTSSQRTKNKWFTQVSLNPQILVSVGYAVNVAMKI